jgi:hypothetical protein
VHAALPAVVARRRTDSARGRCRRRAGRAHGRAHPGTQRPGARRDRAVLDAYFARASSIILLTAHNPAFGQFYAEPGSRAERVSRGGPTLDAANEALGYLEELYPDRIGEACFIDAGGAENARMVRGERATIADLSPDESANPFFAPAFALELGQVYQAKAYESPDTDEWVIANATPVPTADGAKPAIVHFEVTVESFRREAGARGDRTLLSSTRRPARSSSTPSARSGSAPRSATRTTAGSATSAARERHDGTGYPDRLAGEDIPLGARIISACAALAAMTSERPYGEGRALPAALEELHGGAGTQFDPAVVTAVVEVAREPTYAA